MNAIELLMQEHQLILGALDALDAFVAAQSRGGDDRAELARFVHFIRAFADTRHHAKEEDILFVAMVAAGFPRDGGPIAVMLMDHDAGRAHVAAMAERAEQSAPWSDEDRRAMAAACGGYADLLRGHIQKEDRILYPMAVQRLPEEAMRRVDRDCAAFEARQVAAGGDALKVLAGELAARHLPARS
ncbi:MAG: hemerythrin domain-containing protein [Deltaproteobacteria bacterium]